MKTLTLIIVLLLAGIPSETKGQKIVVGSKHFTEGYILSEILAQLLESKGFEVERRFNLGGTLVCFEALKTGAIDIYPEYSGTIAREILRLQTDLPLDQLANETRRQFQLDISPSFGFSNTYALVVTSEKAVALGLEKISDLQLHPEIVAGISYEFLKRQDGWEQLASNYSLKQQPTALEHGLAYEALNEGKIDITDCYSTDGEITKNHLKILNDDKGFFPAYEAVAFYRKDLPESAASAFAALKNSISESEMSAMNVEAVFNSRSFADIAKEFLVKKNLASVKEVRQPGTSDLLLKVIQHLFLTFTALLLAMIVALPLGIWLYWNPRIANVVLYVAGLLQTIPSIALLAIMIPVLGIGSLPAITALFLYAILPILRNTVTGLRTVDPLLKEAAAGLGMTRLQALRIVEWPLSLASVLTGIRIAAVINVGTATLAAFIGAGGLGEYIVTGLALNNTSMILTGAIPAAVLALLIEILFEVIERKMKPKISYDKAVSPQPLSVRGD